MILYYSPGACSLVPHIALQEAGAEYEARRVVLAEGEHRTPDYLSINPHARVPALDIDGQVVTENIAILNYIAHCWGADGSVPVEDHLAAARCNQLLGWFASSVHIGFAQVWRAERFTFDEGAHPAIQAGGHEVLDRHFGEIEARVSDGWIVPGQFTAGDSYLLTFFRWARRIGRDMTAYPRWRGLVDRVLERRTVQLVLATEGLETAEFLPA
ncbi:MAG TPA: glutathione S-transferase C-terminal domain-containing protein [Sphingomicrobium sp.]|nr:glutathione S-transferase C-terminal domain-containing protein [Sphingomicrobium sp.]